jgi:hypothetical protein
LDVYSKGNNSSMTIGIYLRVSSTKGQDTRSQEPDLERFAEGFQANAFLYLLVLRLIPAYPFWIVNIVPALLGGGIPTPLPSVAPLRRCRAGGPHGRGASRNHTAPWPRGIEMQRPAVPVVPCLQHRLQDLPRALDLVVAGEQAGIADHAVQDQRLVGVG